MSDKINKATWYATDNTALIATYNATWDAIDRELNDVK